MKTVFVLALLVAAAYGQFFCPEDGTPVECRELKGYTDLKAFCMIDGTWMCDYCKVKRAHCGKQLKVAIGTQKRCSKQAYPDCSSQQTV